MNYTFFYTSTIIILIVKEITILKDNIKLRIIKIKNNKNKRIGVDKPVSNLRKHIFQGTDNNVIIVKVSSCHKVSPNIPFQSVPNCLL